MKALFLPALLALALAGCGCLDQASDRALAWERVAIGNSRAELEAALGPPDAVAETNLLGVVQTELDWVDGRRRYKAVLIADITVRTKEIK